MKRSLRPNSPESSNGRFLTPIRSFLVSVLNAAIFMNILVIGLIGLVLLVVGNLDLLIEWCTRLFQMRFIL